MTQEGADDALRKWSSDIVSIYLRVYWATGEQVIKGRVPIKRADPAVVLLLKSPYLLKPIRVPKVKLPIGSANR